MSSLRRPPKTWVLRCGKALEAFSKSDMIRSTVESTSEGHSVDWRRPGQTAPQCSERKVRARGLSTKKSIKI